ncbi:hypothetical protein [Flavobacterium soyangense]|uniref:Uncharacterized protein n=1 Tax=Flavobacterium soyangense TaxID=2023265 RepID=A0A930XZW6_9FLAO|nr:hypothetical protein [Flavobacterium soyangense]MBF2709338.1 hypothetical protein [Flavobacterium soyangense]
MKLNKSILLILLLLSFISYSQNYTSKGYYIGDKKGYGDLQEIETKIIITNEEINISSKKGNQRYVISRRFEEETDKEGDKLTRLICDETPEGKTEIILSKLISQNNREQILIVFDNFVALYDIDKEK